MALMAALAIGLSSPSGGSVFWLIPAAAIGGACACSGSIGVRIAILALMVCALLLVEILVSASFVGGDEETGQRTPHRDSLRLVILLLCLPFIPKCGVPASGGAAAFISIASTTFGARSPSSIRWPGVRPPA